MNSSKDDPRRKFPGFPPTERGIRKMQRWAKLTIKDKEKLELFISGTKRYQAFLASKNEEKEKS